MAERQENKYVSGYGSTEGKEHACINVYYVAITWSWKTVY